MRQEKEGYVCGPDTVWQREFEEMFPYEETEDQLSAIEDANVIWRVPGLWTGLSAGMWDTQNRSGAACRI